MWRLNQQWPFKVGVELDLFIDARALGGDRPLAGACEIKSNPRSDELLRRHLLPVLFVYVLVDAIRGGEAVLRKIARSWNVSSNWVNDPSGSCPACSMPMRA